LELASERRKKVSKQGKERKGKERRTRKEKEGKDQASPTGILAGNILHV